MKEQYMQVLPKSAIVKALAYSIERWEKQYEYLVGAIYTIYFPGNDDTEDDGISFGAFYRWNDALVPTIKLNYQHLTLDFSYDFNVSQLVPGSQAWGGPELMVKYRGFLPAKPTDCAKRGCL